MLPTPRPNRSGFCKAELGKGEQQKNICFSQWFLLCGKLEYKISACFINSGLSYLLFFLKKN